MPPSGCAASLMQLSATTQSGEPRCRLQVSTEHLPSRNHPKTIYTACNIEIDRNGIDRCDDLSIAASVNIRGQVRFRMHIMSASWKA